MIKIDRYYPKSVLMQGLAEYYQLIEIPGPLMMKTIPNGRVDAWVTISGFFEFLEKGKSTFFKAPECGFFPLSENCSDVRVSKKLICLNIKFYPHILHFKALSHLLKEDSLVSFQSLFGEEKTSQFRSSFITQKTISEKFELIESFFQSVLFPDQINSSWMVAVIKELEKDDLCIPLGQIARNVHVTVKTMGRRFKKATGLSPKTFQKLIRFQRAIKEIQKTSPKDSPDLLSLSLASGYYDQSHFVKECKNITGLSPRKLQVNFVPKVTDVFILNKFDESNNPLRPYEFRRPPVG